MSNKTSKDTWANTGICPICDRSRGRDRELAEQKKALLDVLEKQQHILNMAILATPTGEIREKLTEMNIERHFAIAAATN